MIALRYAPDPIDTSRIELTDDIQELIERLARNTHDAWAQTRLSEGWTYGPTRNDERKETPCLVPYEELPEAEKEVDRQTARKVLKAMIAMGYNIRPAEPADR